MLFPSNRKYADVTVKFSKEALGCSGEDSPLAALILAVRTAVAAFDQAMVQAAAAPGPAQGPGTEGTHLLEWDPPAAPGPRSPQSSIGMDIVTARRAIVRLTGAKVAAMDLSHNEYCMLMSLSHHAPTSLTELAQVLRLDCPTVSRTVKQLARRGYLTGLQDPQHRRRIVIRLTAEGDLLGAELSRIDADFQEGAQTGLAVEEVALMRRVLARYIHNLDLMAAVEPSVLCLPSAPAREPAAIRAMA